MGGPELAPHCLHLLPVIVEEVGRLSKQLAGLHPLPGTRAGEGRRGEEWEVGTFKGQQIVLTSLQIVYQYSLKLLLCTKQVLYLYQNPHQFHRGVVHLDDLLGQGHLVDGKCDAREAQLAGHVHPSQLWEVQEGKAITSVCRFTSTVCFPNPMAITGIRTTEWRPGSGSMTWFAC